MKPKEIEAVEQCILAIKDLDPYEKARVLSWVMAYAEGRVPEEPHPYQGAN